MSQNSTTNHTIKKFPIIDTNYLFIDGMSRAGKNSIVQIISSFNRVEHYKDKATYDRILVMYETGNLTKQGFKYLFETDLIMDVWFAMIGRDVNTNLHDVSSIMNSPRHGEYLERTNRKDTPNTFNEIKKEIKERRLIFPFVSDNFILSGDLLSEISKSFKYMIVMRNPIDMVFTWFRSGRGTRLGTDPRYTIPAFQIRGFDNLYHSVLDNAEEYSKANPLEKCFLVLEKDMTKYLDSDLLHSSTSCLVPVENYWLETDKYIKKFENFLGTTKSEFTNNEMINSNVPRKKNNENFSMKANMIFDNMNDNYIERLKNLCRRYENEVSDIYKLSLINKSPKGKFKGLSIDKFSQISAESKYHRGKLKVNK